jgi:hypothetical protein
MNVTPEFPILETSRSHYGGEGKVVILALRFGPVLWILPTSKGDKEVLFPANDRKHQARNALNRNDANRCST